MNKSKSGGEVIIEQEACKGCGLCVDACPVDALYLADGLNRRGYHPAVYKGEKCTGCGVCFYVCPEPGGIKVVKRQNQARKVRT